MNDKLGLGFVATSAILLTIMGLAWLKNESREHRQFQGAFQRLSQGRAPALGSGFADGLDVVPQIWLPRLNRVDRCVSCHLGVAEPNFRDAALPFSYHTEIAHAPDDFNRFGCVSCHDGQGLATTQLEAHGKTAHWPKPLIDAAHIEGRCGRCHQAGAVPEAPGLTRGRTLIKQLGCFNCHAAGGRAEFLVEGPPLEGLSLKVSRSWLHRWLKNPKEVDLNARMPNFHLGSSEIEALTEYLLSRPPSAGQELLIRQAALEPDGDPEAGARLFRTSRCISCHTLEGKGHGSAPELSEVGSKASKAWLLAFMKDTHAFNRTTVMPSFRFSSTELRDLVTYMKDELRDFDDPSAADDDRRASEPLIKEGRHVFVKYGCRACHSTTNGEPEDLGPDLSAIGDVKVSSLDFGARRDLPRTLPAWLKAKMTEPRSFGPGLKMPSFVLSEEEGTDVTTALLSLSVEYVPEDFRRRDPSTVKPAARPPSGEVGRLFSKYRCLACHLIGELGTDLSTAPLTFEGSKTKREWLAQYLVLPQTIYPLLTERMPVLGITPTEAQQMADYISTVYVDDAIPARASLNQGRNPATVANGARLFRDKGCQSCHIVGKTGGYVGPPLGEAGDRLQSEWIAFWLDNPQQWRREARCPNYGLSQDEIRDLTAYLSSQSAQGGTRP